MPGKTFNTNPDKIGALWKGKTAKGDATLSGQLELDGEKIRINVIKNGFKKDEKQPDYVIFKNKDTTGGAKKAATPDDDVPF